MLSWKTTKKTTFGGNICTKEKDGFNFFCIFRRLHIAKRHAERSITAELNQLIDPKVTYTESSVTQKRKSTLWKHVCASRLQNSTCMHARMSTHAHTHTHFWTLKNLSFSLKTCHCDISALRILGTSVFHVRFIFPVLSEPEVEEAS